MPWHVLNDSLRVLSERVSVSLIAQLKILSLNFDELNQSLNEVKAGCCSENSTGIHWKTDDINARQEYLETKRHEKRFQFTNKEKYDI